MFWGLLIKDDKQYSHTVETAFHISMAVLDKSSSNSEEIDLLVNLDGDQYLLCTLSPTHFQQQLDLNFSEGESITFYTRRGKGKIHLTGYNLEDDEIDAEESSEDEAFDTTMETSASKEAVENAKAAATQVLKSKKRKAEEVTPAAKKPKVGAAQLLDESLDDEDEEDEDFDLDIDSDDELEEESDEELDVEEEEDEYDSSEEESPLRMEVKESPKKTPAKKQKGTPFQKQQTPGEKKSPKQKQTPGLKHSPAGTGSPMKTPTFQKSGQKTKHVSTPFPKQKPDTPITPMSNGTPSEKKKKKKRKSKGQQQQQGENTTPQFQKGQKMIKGGITVETLKKGFGPEAEKGKFVRTSGGRKGNTPK